MEGGGSVPTGNRGDTKKKRKLGVNPEEAGWEKPAKKNVGNKTKYIKKQRLLSGVTK